MKINNVLSLCDGISGGQMALNRLGIKYDNYFASEIDKYAIKITMHNYPNTIQLGDVTKLDTKPLPEPIDLLMAGSPCQNFSFSGKKKGMVTKDNIEITTLDQYLVLKNDGFEFEGQSFLFWEFVRVLNEVKPRYFLLENVPMVKKWENIISTTLGVEPILIDSALVSAQTRKRLYWTNIPGITQPENKGIIFEDIEDGEGYSIHSVKPYSSIPYEVTKAKNYHKWDPSGKKWFSQTNRIYYRKGKIATLTTSICPLVEAKKEGYYRKLSVTELEKLQTLPSGYTQIEGISPNKSLHGIGNGWTIDVIAHIFSFMEN